MSHSTFSTLTKEAKGKITDDRNAVVKQYDGAAIGWCKAAYQNEDSVFIMRDHFAKVLNIFGVKPGDANHFLVDVLAKIQLHETQLLQKQTYAAPSIRTICKSPLPRIKSPRSASYWTMQFNFTKDAPYVRLINVKDGDEHNGITCFVKELLIFARFINSKQSLVNDLLFNTSTIRSGLNDKELFC